MDVGLPLEVPESQVLVQGPRSQFLVWGDDMDPLLHPLEVQSRRHFACCGVNDDCVGDVAVGKVLGKALHVNGLCSSAAHTLNE